MGIRYYAYAFDGEMTESALDDPRRFISRDPLADAWGLPQGFTVGTTNFEQGPPAEEMLYLDKVWNNLQHMTAPTDPNDVARPAYRMFEGKVTPADDWGTWHPWVRVILPEEVPEIAADLATITERDFVPHYSRFDGCSAEDRESESIAVTQFIGRTRRFLAGLEKAGRGFVYMIG